MKRSPLRRVSKKKARSDREYSVLRKLVLEGASCAVCGGIAECTHHVLPRSRGGKHTVANLLPLCHRDHQLIHANPEWAREKGYLR